MCSSIQMQILVDSKTVSLDNNIFFFHSNSSLCIIEMSISNFHIHAICLTDLSSFPFCCCNLNKHIEWICIGHPVHGVEIELDNRPYPDFALIGKALRCETCRDVEGFLVIVDGETGETIWQWSPGYTEDDALNAVVQLPPQTPGSSGDLIVVGHDMTNGVAKRMIARIDPNARVVKWIANDFGDTNGSHGAWEMVSLSDDKSSILLGGVQNRATTEEMWFKSYGNVFDGNAVVMEVR